MSRPALDLATAVRISRKAYEAAADPEAWRGVMETLVQALGACAGGIHFRQRLETESWSTAERASQVWVGLPPEFEGEYLAHYWREDPWAPGVAGAPEGQVRLPGELIPERTLVRTRFYNELCRPFGFQELIAGPVVNNGESIVAGAGFFRRRGEEPFGEQEKQFLELILPHLRNATLVSVRVAKGPPSDAGAGSGGEVPTEVGTSLDRLPVGAVAVDASGRVMRMNRAARRVLSRNDGLSIGPEGLRTPRGVDMRALQATIARATGAARGGEENSVGGGLLLPRPSGGAPITVTVAPLRPDSLRARETPGAAAIVFLVDPTTEVVTSVSLLKRLYGLTEAEARIARLVGGGRSPREAADELGIAWNTARFQLKQVFAKTGVDRQSALARLLILLGIASPD